MKQIFIVVSILLSANALADEVIQKIAFGSCAMQTKAQPIWRAILKQQPDLFLFIGDAIYSDYDGKNRYPPTEETLKRDWNLLANEPNFKTFREQVPIMATWDNHDYGHYQAGEEFALKEISKNHFLNFFGEPDESIRRNTPGIYDAKVLGTAGKRVQIILLDTRSFKTVPKLAERPDSAKGSLGKFAPNNDPDASLLGKEQWQWLQQQLSVPAEMRLLVSSTQIIADEKGMDEWGNYPIERQRLFDLLADANTKNIVMLSGNVHFSEISELQYKNINLVDFTASGLTHTNKVYANANNKYRVSNVYDDINFGIVEIDWDATPSPSIKLVTLNDTGESVIEYLVRLQDSHTQ